MFFDGKLEPSAFVFAGIANGDIWIQPQIHWKPDDHWDVSVRADLAGGVNGIAPGYFPNGSDFSRAMLWLAWKL